MQGMCQHVVDGLIGLHTAAQDRRHTAVCAALPAVWGARVIKSQASQGMVSYNDPSMSCLVLAGKLDQLAGTSGHEHGWDFG